MRKRHAVIITAGFLATLAYWLVPDSIPELGRRTIAIFVVASVLWATEAIPLYATSLCAIGLQILVLAEKGGLAGQGGLSFADFLAPFSSGVIILFMGGFLLSKALTKSGVDEFIASRLLKPFSTSPLRLIYGILTITSFFSMWMSNTATAAMMLALLIPILKTISHGNPYRLALILAVPFGANIGGIGTPIGSPPNAIALASLRKMGFDVGFLKWMGAAVPLMIILIGLTGGLLYFFYKPPKGFLLRGLPNSTNPIGMKGWLVMAILGISILLWLTSQWHGINEAVVALLAAASLTAFQILDKKDVDSIDWNILILMWGGLSLSNAISLTKLTEWLAGLPLASIPGLSVHTLFVLLSVGLSAVMSNTAAASLIIPLALFIPMDNPVILAILVAYSCSFSMAFPISTPPNALAFASGEVTARQMFRAGSIISIIGVALLLLGFQVVLPVLFPGG